MSTFDMKEDSMTGLAQVFTSGNEAIAEGAVAAGARFTPDTPSPRRPKSLKLPPGGFRRPGACTSRWRTSCRAWPPS